jgi:hypothetical protein
MHGRDYLRKGVELGSQRRKEEKKEGEKEERGEKRDDMWCPR